MSEFIGKTCPYCKTPFQEGDDVVICSVCEMPHHKECWVENRECTTFGCTGTIQGISAKNAGLAFCPHCDGPFYKGKDVAVIGRGNSGIEAAIDLAGICRKVTVVEFADTLKADEVLQKKVASLANVEVFTSSQTTEVIGNGSKMTALRVKDRTTGEEREIALDGVFVQIGLAANSASFAEHLDTNAMGEIKIDERCRTSVAGVYAAGDVSTVPYKQIVVAMGEGAKAALTAFDDRIRNNA